MKHFLLLSLLLSLPFQYSCSRDYERGTPTTSGDRQKPTLTDSDLENQIERSFQADPQLRDAKLSVSADARRNTATLSGTVTSEALRMRAVQLAKSAHSGLEIVDKIDVKPRG